MSDEDLRSAWDRGKPMDVDRSRRNSTSVLSVRVPDSVMEELTARARAQDKAACTLAREILESALVEDAPVTPTTLASMFRRWVGEALVSRPTSTFDLVFASRVITDGLWVSQVKPFSPTNYDFAETSPHFFGFKHPLVTSRTVESETEPAGEDAA